MAQQLQVDKVMPFLSKKASLLPFTTEDQLSSSMFVVALTFTTIIFAGLICDLVYDYSLKKVVAKHYGKIMKNLVRDCLIYWLVLGETLEFCVKRGWVPAILDEEGITFLLYVVVVYHVEVLLSVFCADMGAWYRVKFLLNTEEQKSAETNIHDHLVKNIISRSSVAFNRILLLINGILILSVMAMLSWAFGDSAETSTTFLVLIFAIYCGAPFACVELNDALPERLQVWLFHWKDVEKCWWPPKLVVAFLFIPFALGVLIGQLLFRSVTFLLWVTLRVPCLFLAEEDNMHDKFVRDASIPLLQCSFQIFACGITAIHAFESELSLKNSVVCKSVLGVFSAYYSLFLVCWTGPSVLRAKGTKTVLDANQVPESRKTSLQTSEEGLDEGEALGECLDNGLRLSPRNMDVDKICDSNVDVTEHTNSDVDNSNTNPFGGSGGSELLEEGKGSASWMEEKKKSNDKTIPLLKADHTNKLFTPEGNMSREVMSTTCGGSSSLVKNDSGGVSSPDSGSPVVFAQSSVTVPLPQKLDLSNFYEASSSRTYTMEEIDVIDDGFSDTTVVTIPLESSEIGHNDSFDSDMAHMVGTAVLGDDNQVLRHSIEEPGDLVSKVSSLALDSLETCSGNRSSGVTSSDGVASPMGIESSNSPMRTSVRPRSEEVEEEKLDVDTSAGSSSLSSDPLTRLNSDISSNWAGSSYTKDGSSFSPLNARNNYVVTKNTYNLINEVVEENGISEDCKDSLQPEDLCKATSGSDGRSQNLRL